MPINSIPFPMLIERGSTPRGPLFGKQYVREGSGLIVLDQHDEMMVSENGLIRA